MKKEYRVKVSETDATFVCIEKIRQENPHFSYKACFNLLCSEYQRMEGMLSSQAAIADLTVEKLKEEYDPIWRVRSYATGKNVEVLLEVINGILLQFDVAGVPTDKKKATALSLGETTVNDRLRGFRTRALTKKGKRK